MIDRLPMSRKPPVDRQAGEGCMRAFLVRPNGAADASSRTCHKDLP